MIAIATPTAPTIIKITPAAQDPTRVVVSQKTDSLSLPNFSGLIPSLLLSA
jgi:hypothetical protein